MGGPPPLIVIRIRGSWGVDAETENLLRLLNLRRANHAVILPKSPSVLGMLRRINSYVTWGEATPEILLKLFKRADPQPGVKVEEELRKLNAESIENLAQKICSGEIDVKSIERIFKPVFRLHPPKGGFKGSIKRPVSQKGVLGYAGERIGQLVEVMS